MIQLAGTSGKSKAQLARELGLTDITYVPTKEGRRYLATVLDVCYRRVVGRAHDRVLLLEDQERVCH